MEWVETTGKTVEEAKERALSQLGVHPEDAEFEVIEEPKAGLFGRVRGEARVRARVRPTQVRQKIERRDRKRGSDRPAGKSQGGAKSGGQGDRQPREPKPKKQQSKPAQQQDGAAPKQKSPSTHSSSTHTEERTVDAQQVGEEAVQFMSGLLTAFGLEGEVSLTRDGDELEVQVHGQELGLLVGPRGTTLQAVQDLARVASQRRLGDHDTRLRLDIGGYRERRRAALGNFARQMAEEVKSSGVARVLEPMLSADRKIIHDTLAEIDGIATRSEGDDPYRRVVIAPAND